jgi:hypothetical protein
MWSSAVWVVAQFVENELRVINESHVVGLISKRAQFKGDYGGFVVSFEKLMGKTDPHKDAKIARVERES